MTYDKMFELGQKTKNKTFSKIQKDLQIEILNSVISYLDGRGDSGIICKTLREDLG
jgi:hypothetical protein